MWTPLFVLMERIFVGCASVRCVANATNRKRKSLHMCVAGETPIKKEDEKKRRKEMVKPAAAHFFRARSLPLSLSLYLSTSIE